MATACSLWFKSLDGELLSSSGILYRKVVLMFWDFCRWFDHSSCFALAWGLAERSYLIYFKINIIYIYINIINTIFYHAISGICIWHILWHSIWYIFGDSLWLISGGEHSAPELTVEVQRGTLWSGRGTLWSWASGGGPAGSHSGPELALEVWQEHFEPEGAVGSGGNTAI